MFSAIVLFEVTYRKLLYNSWLCKMMNLSRAKEKLKQSGFLGLFASALRRAASHIDIISANNSVNSHQTSAYRVLSRYTSFEGKDILEVGGAQSCDSAYPFLKKGAASVIVTGLQHITQEQTNKGQNLRIVRADALALSSVFEPCSFDIVYGLSIVEHIPSPKILLDEVYKVLKPGGLAYLEGNPIWSSPKGHHLWVSTSKGPYQNKATANYLFSEWPGAKSTNPLPDWSHLLMTPKLMREYLAAQSIPSTDIECIIDWVYYSNNVNRINMSDIAEGYTTSKLIVLEANTVRVGIPHDVQLALRKQFGDRIDYGICGVSYVLAKP
jgi:ubiquinone/menaquinone biosynthesis C-methylase UbiE